MPATTGATKTLLRIAAIAGDQAFIGGARVLTGFKRWTEAENFDVLVKALTDKQQAYFWVALRRIPSLGINEAKRFVFDAELVVPVDKESSDDLVGPWDLAVGLQDALENEASYGAGEFVPIVSIGFKGVEKRYGIARWDFGDGEAGGSMESIDP
ncbi:MAG: hypothetical protein M5U26_08440 [Planctomycetota bacterium]|nr:hypothetical protein [Planctomycetota bacterium]